MTSPRVNGEVSNADVNSAFIRHLLGYPVINDGVKRYQENEYGQRSLQLGDSAYKTFAAPVVHFFSKPYQYVSPYVKRADDLGDHTLSRVDERFPAIKKPTDELYADAKFMVLLPYRKGVEGKDHVVDLYSNEYKKVGGDGLVTHAKTLVTTVLIVSTETLTWVSSFLAAKKEEARDVMNEKMNNNSNN